MFTTFSAPGEFSLLTTANTLETRPAYVYRDGQKTSEQRTWKGQPLYRLMGALPLMDDDLVLEGFIYVTSENVPRVSVGQVLTLEGEISVRAAKKIGLACSLFGSLTSDDGGALPDLDLGGE